MRDKSTLGPIQAAFMRRLLRTVDARLTDFHRQEAVDLWPAAVESELKAIVAGLPSHCSAEELLPVLDRFIEMKAGELRLAVDRRYDRRLSELEELHGKVGPVRHRFLLLAQDEERRLDQMHAAVMHAMERLADIDAPLADPRGHKWNTKL